MSQEWSYIKEGKGKLGPVSPAELQALARSGQLLPTDMVLKQGMTKWMQASEVKGLFASVAPAHSPKLPAKPARTILEPPPNEAVGQEGPGAAVISQFTLGLAIFLSLVAGVFSVLPVGAGILSPIIASLAVLAALVAVGVGLLARKSRPYLGSAATALFLGVAAVVFTIGSPVAARIIQNAIEATAKATEAEREATAKAVEVENERRRGETARREAKEFRDQAEAKLDEAQAQPRKNAQLLQDIKTAQAKLDTEQVTNAQLLKDIKKAQAKVDTDQATNAELLSDIKTAQAKLDKERTKYKTELDEQYAGHKAKLDKEREKEQLSLKKQQKEEESALKMAEAVKMEASKHRKNGDDALEKAKTKEDEAEKFYKKILEEYNKVQKQLKATAPEARKEAIDVIMRIGAPPESANLDLSDIHHDLCEIAVKIDAEDTKALKQLRADALSALGKIQPEFGRLVATINQPPVDIVLADYIGEIQKLADFGRAGLPLIGAHFDRKVLAVKNTGVPGEEAVFVADAKVLAKIAHKDKGALAMLVSAPKSKLIGRIDKVNPLAKYKIKSRKEIGERLREIVVANPQVRKEKEVADYFIGLLQSQKPMDLDEVNRLRENRRLGCEVLGIIGADAKYAVKELQKLQTDEFTEVRNAARDAIKKIEAAD